MFYFIMFASYLIIAPVMTLLHEMGHALPILLFTNEHVKIIWGKDKGKSRELVIGRVTFSIKSYALFTGFCYHTGQVTRFQKILFMIGGPLTSLILLITILFLANSFEDLGLVQTASLNACFWITGSTFIKTILPMTYRHGDYKGFTSDGKKILELLKKS